MPRSSAGPRPASARRRLRLRPLRFAVCFAALAVAAPLVGVGPTLLPRPAPAPAGAAARGPFSALPPSAPPLIRRRVVAIQQPGPASSVVVLARPVLLSDSPRGKPVARLGAYTEFGSPRVLAVVASRPGWLGVLAAERPNGAPAWIPAAGAVVLADPYAIDVDLTRRQLRVYSYGRLVRRVEVGIGSSQTPTPTGRFAVTDTLTTNGPSPYGCCVLALTGRQPKLAPGWEGGDRLAIHATTEPGTIGSAASLGCLRASDGDARWLISNVPLGTVVKIR